MRQPRKLFYDNQLDQAHKELTQLQKRRKREADVLGMDLAVVDLVSGKPKEAEQRLRLIRDHLEELEGKSLAESAASMITDDKSRSYAGEDYEKVLLRVFLALSNLMHDGGDAEAYSLQVNAKQQQLFEKVAKDSDNASVQRYAEAYRPLAIGHYLRGMLRESTLGNYDDASRSYEAALALAPGCDMLRWDVNRARSGVHSAPGHGVLYVFALVGRGPYKVEVAEQATSDALLIADRIVSVVGPYSVPPTLAPVKIPKVVVPPRSIERIAVRVGQQPIGPTSVITDIGLLADQTYQVQLPQIMARAVARRVVKKAAVYAAKDGLSAGTPLASLGMDAVGVAWEATESADTRCWGLLPREIQILRVEIPAGVQRVSLQPLIGVRPVAEGCHADVRITDGKNSYLLAYFPDEFSIGKVLVSQKP